MPNPSQLKPPVDYAPDWQHELLAEDDGLAPASQALIVAAYLAQAALWIWLGYLIGGAS